LIISKALKSYSLFLLFFLITLIIKGQEWENSIPTFEPKFSFVQSFGLHSYLEEKFQYPYDFLLNTRLFSCPNEKVAFGLNSKLIHFFGGEVEPIWFYHLGIINQYHFYRKRREENGNINFSVYLEVGLNVGNYFFQRRNFTMLFLPEKRFTLNADIGIGVKKYLSDFLYIDIGIGGMPILYQKIPQEYYDYQFYRIGLGRDLIFQKKSGINRNTRNL
jgi:hypothetical protein